MKKALLPIILGLLLSHAAHAAFVQQVETSTATTTSPQNLPAMTVTAGDCLVLVVAGPKPTDAVTVTGATFTSAVAAGGLTSVTLASAPTGSSATLAANWTLASGNYVITFSDKETRYASFTNGSAAVSWTTALTGSPTTSANVGENDGLVAFYEANATGGSTSISVSAPGNLYGAYLAEYSGCATSGALLAVTAGAISTPNTGANAITTDVMSTGSIPSDVIGFTWTPGQTTASTDISAGTGYTARTSVFGTLGKYGFPEDQQPSSGTSFSATWTSDSSAQYDGFIQLAIALKAASGSPCTHAGWNLATRTFTVPTAGSGSFWHSTGASGSVDCSTASYWQSSRTFGVN